MTPGLRKAVLITGNLVRGLLLGLLLCYAIQNTVLVDQGAVIVRYAGY